MADEHPDQPRWTDYVDVDELVPDPRNAKLHADDELDASLKRFGFTESIQVDERTGMLIAGHGRRELVMRARERGDDIPDGVVVRDDRWLVPVTRGWSSKDDVEAEAYLVASNLLPPLGGFDDHGLAEALQRVAATSSLAGVGMTEVQLADLLASLAPPPSLADLAATYGDPSEADLYPVMRFKVAPALKERWLRLAGGVSNDDTVQFAYVLDLAERGLEVVQAEAAAVAAETAAQ